MEHLTDSTFNDTIKNATVPVLVDFYADWCQPCRMVAPTVDKVANELKGSVAFYKLDIEANPQTTSQEQISTLPTFVLYNKGKRVAIKTGLMTEKGLRDLIGSVT